MSLSSYIKDKSGGTAIFFSVAVSVLLMSVGAAIDMSSMVSTKTRVGDLADNMALAGAIAASQEYTDPKRTRQGKRAAKGAFSSSKGSDIGVTLTEPTIVVDNVAKEVRVTVEAKVQTSLMGIFGKKQQTVKSSSVVAFNVDHVPPISMAFAFDTSGSMGFAANGDPSKTRMQVLQEATELLFTSLVDAAEAPNLLKDAFSSSISSYNTALVNSQDWQYGASSMDAVQLFADAMVADGGTNSLPSMEYTRDQMITNRPVDDPSWRGYVLFMTDGENNNSAVDDPATLAVCDELKADPQITVITVAFSAPSVGKKLLKACATSKKQFYKSENAKEIKRDFTKIGREIGESTIRLKS